MELDHLISKLETALASRKMADEIAEKAKEREEGLRAEIMQQMLDDGIRSLRSNSEKMTVSIAARRDLKVVDELTVREYLQSNGLLESCLRLDVVKVKSFAKSREIPGIDEVESDVLTVRFAKEAADEIPQDETPQQFRDRVRKERE